MKLSKKLKKNNVNVFVTAVTVKNDSTKKAHEFAEKHQINILG